MDGESVTDVGGGDGVELRFTAKDATEWMEACAKGCERLASVANWKLRTVTRGTAAACAVLAVLSASVKAEDMMCVIALYVTRPNWLKVVPGPIGSAWARLPSNWKTVIQ